MTDCKHAAAGPMPSTTTNVDPSLNGVVGIQNVGNTCYLNSTVQILRAIPEWTAFCLNKNLAEECGEKKDTNQAKMLLAYQDLIKTMWSTHKPAFVRPLGFIANVRTAVKGSVYEMFGMPIPNDSHEFLIYLLDNFHEAISKKVNTAIDTVPTTEMTELARRGWGNFIKTGHSPVVDLFFGMIRKTIECQTCKAKTYQWEVFNILKIPCEGSNFMDWIANELTVSELSGYACEKCSPVRCSAKMYSHIWCLPQALFIALRRFKPNGQKEMCPCPYAGETIELGKYFAEESPEQSKGWKYTLCGIVDHHGSHMGGHYNTQFKHPTSQEWWLLDDERAHKLVQPCFNGANYLFLFRQTV